MNFQPNNKTRVASIVVIGIVKDTAAHGRNLLVQYDNGLYSADSRVAGERSSVGEDSGVEFA